MTGSQWLDLALYALAAAAAISGWINGAAASGFALLGVAIGATSGLLVAPHLVRELDSPVGRLAAGLAVIAVMVIIGQIAGVTIGRAARRYISGAGAKVLDSTVRVEKGMYCRRHDRACYLKYDGFCGAYTPDHIRTHSTQLVSSPPLSKVSF